MQGSNKKQMHLPSTPISYRKEAFVKIEVDCISNSLLQDYINLHCQNEKFYSTWISKLRKHTMANDFAFLISKRGYNYFCHCALINLKGIAN